MVDFENDMHEGVERAGAAAAFTPTPEDLPLIVWLTGTEPWFSEFSLEADEVMAMLGIKRSRLTQIAGREIRVGRVRRGRYVSPVFRPVDVEQYLAWVRAPASHVKSAGILSDAADALKAQSEEIERRFADLRADVVADFAGMVNRNLQEAHGLYRSLQSGLDSALDRAQGEFSARMEFMARRHDELATQVAQVTTVMEKLQAGQMLLLKTLQEMQVRTSSELDSVNTQIESSLTAGFAALEQAQKKDIKPQPESRDRPANWRLRARKRDVADAAARPVKTRTRLLARARTRIRHESE
jgi:hypothetical protein